MKRKAKNSQTGPFDEENYRAIFESIHEGFCIYEVIYDSGKPVDLRWIEVNPAYAKQTGLTDVVGKLHSELGLATEQYWFDIYDQVARTGEAVHFENWHEPTARWYHVFTSRISGVQSRQVAVLFEDITERKEHEERQAFLLRFSDLLRAQPDEQSIKEQTVSMLGEHLRADRCYISEVFEQQGFSTVGPEHIRRADIPPMTCVYQLSDYPETMRQLATQPMVVHDAANDPRFSESEKALLAGLPQQALLVAPLRKGPREVIWALVAAMATPRHWTEAERVLLEEVGERTWAAIERARAEEALRASEERFRTIFETIDEGFAIVELERDESGNVKDIIYREVNESFERYSGLTNAVGGRASDLLPNLEQSIIDVIQTVADTGEPHRMEIHVADLDRWFNIIYSRVGGAGSPFIAGVFDDITERKRREMHQTLLSEVSKELVRLENIEVTMERLSEKIANHFGVPWCILAELSDDHETILASYGWNAEAVPSLKGTYRMRDLWSEEQIAKNNAGELTIVDDTQNDPRVNPEFYAVLGIGSFILVPLIRNNQFKFMQSISDIKPRQWREDEIDLIRELASRIWARLEHARAEEALRQSERRLQLLNNSLEERVYEKTAELRTLASELTKAEQRERDRISHILHDDLQQQIYSVLMQFSTLRKRLSAQDETTRQEAIDLEMQLREVLKVARNLSIDLNPPILPGEGLLHAIQWLAGQMLERYSLPVEVQAVDSVVLSNHELHILLFNCVRELLFNVVKHADASHAAVRLHKADGNLHIEVRDNGKGFSTNLPWQMENQTIALEENLPLSFGLSTISHKLSLYDGTMEITSKVGEGTQITLVVPVAKNGSD